MKNNGALTVPSVSVKVSLLEALARLPSDRAEKFAEVFSNADVAIEVYAPETVDGQQPHARDEIYVVARGHGEFVTDHRQSFTNGDIIFVPAGVRHRFENFSEDFFVWVIFCGPTR